MRLLTILSLLCLIFTTSFAKKKEKERSYWESALNDVYEHASDASEKLTKVSTKAYEHVHKVVTSPEVSRVASGAYEAAGQLGQKAVEASSAAFDTINSAINSPEAAQAASDAYATASTIGQKAVEASSTAFKNLNQAIESGSLKKQATQVASDVYSGSVHVAEELGKSLIELSKGRQEGETWTGYLERAVPYIVYGHGKEAVQKEERTHEHTARDGATMEAEAVVDEEKVVEEKKLPHLTEYAFFWRDINGTSLSDSFSHFMLRFNYGEDEDEKRIANLGFATAIRELAGTFRQLNAHGRNAIYTLESGAGWSMRNINKVGKTPIYKPSLFGSTFSHFGSIFWYGSVLAETVNVVNAAAKDLDEGTSTNTMRASSKAVASWTGAAVGASAGATLFSVVPVVGTLAGGLIGGFTGAYAGEVAGEASANAYADSIKG